MYSISLFVHLQNTHWSDGSPVLYNNIDTPDRFKLATLLNSFADNRYKSSSINDRYIKNLKDKLLLSANHNDSTEETDTICFAALLTIITGNEWLPINCEQLVTNSHYLCEYKHLTRQKESAVLPRHDYSCQETYTYIMGECLSIKLSNSQVQYIFNFSIIQVFTMLSAWSYGHPSRTFVQVYTGNELRCFKTNAQRYHFKRNWVIGKTICQTTPINHMLSKGTLILYNYICNNNLHFTCELSYCVLSSLVCDGNYDCPDNSDEVSCNNNHGVIDNKCDDLYFSCNICIPVAHRCDGWQDCLDGSDELQCLYNGNFMITKDVDPTVIQVRITNSCATFV